MTKCKNCGTEFDSKFCPNCGKPIDAATEITTADTTSSVISEQPKMEENALSETEKFISTYGIDKAWQMTEKRDYKVSFIFQTIGVACLIGCGVLLLIVILKFYEFFTLNSVKQLLIYESYKHEIKILFIPIFILMFFNIVTEIIANYYASVKTTNWVKSLNINVPRMIRSLPVCVEKKQRLKIESIKCALFAASRVSYADIGRECIKGILINKLISIILSIAALITLYYMFTSIIDKDDVIVLIFIIGLMIIVDFPLQQLINNIRLKKISREVDAWIKTQTDDESKTQQSQNNV